jgi:hypothetical protein
MQNDHLSAPNRWVAFVESKTHTESTLGWHIHNSPMPTTSFVVLSSRILFGGIVFGGIFQIHAKMPVPIWTLLCVTTAVVFLLVYWRMGKAFPPLTDVSKQQHYELLSRFGQFCDHHNITMFMIGGTLLGAIRHADMIPWDNDADVGVLENDLSLLLGSKGTLKKNYDLLLVDHSPGLYKIFLKSTGVDNRRKHVKPCLDVFVYCVNTKTNRIEYISAHHNRTWPQTYFLPEEIATLRRYNFGRTRVWGPSFSEASCVRMWGPNWRNPKPKWGYMFLHPFTMRKLLATYRPDPTFENIAR